MGKYASEVVKLAQSWVGIKEGSEGHQMILDIYNSQNPLPRGYAMKMKDAWCAATVTAIAVKLGYTDIIPCECSCTKMIAKAKEMGIWIEDESVTPNPGWFPLYDWDDKSASGDCKGDPEHIGVAEKVVNGEIIVIEGNADTNRDGKDGVERRPVAVNGKYLRGFIAPKYDAEPENKPDVKPDSGSTSTIKVELDQLKKGSEGEQVKALQRMLYAMGYELGDNNPIDGDFGSKTDTAVRAYQKKKSLTIDGIVGTKTWNKLLKG